MSCQTHELPREDRLEAEVEIIENDSLNNKSNDKNQEEVSAEYLHEKKRKRSARKKDYDMEEERLRRWNESVQEWKHAINSNSNIKIIKNIQKEKVEEKMKKLDEDKKRWYGDHFRMSKQWPRQTNDGIIRIYGQNVNGVSKYMDYNEWEIILEHLNKYQVDIACLTEINLDLNMAGVKYKLHEKAKRLDKTCSVMMTTSKSTMSDNEYKRGGIISIIRGHLSGREYEKGADKLGRWTFNTLSGKANRKVTIITIYRVCDQKSHGDGGCTIYMQQERDLMVEKRKNTDPRSAILEDVTTFITTLRNKGHDIILLGDMNSDMDSCKKMEEFLRENELFNIIKEKHPGQGPATYDRGTKCIDLVAISNTIHPSSIKKCGYLPFYKGIFSDHRGMYVDIDTRALFSKVRPDTNLDNYKNFTTSHVKNCQKYLDNMHAHIIEAAIETKVDDLQQRMKQYEETGEGNISTMIKECKTLFEKTTQVMKSSERKIGKKKYKNCFPSSNKLRKAASKVVKLKKELRYQRTSRKIDLDKIVEAKSKLKEAKSQLKQCQKEAPTLREKDLMDLAAKRANQWNLKASKAIIVIKNAEEAKKVHRKQRIFLKPRKSGVKKIAVPTPRTELIPDEKHITDMKVQCYVDDSKEIFNILLRQNYNQLLQSKKSVFTSGEMVRLMGYETDGDIVNDILDGKQLEDNIYTSYKEYGTTLENFIRHMKKATIKDGSTIPEFTWSFGVDEYKEIFSHTKEATACGPSGLHMSHWKAAEESTTIMKIHSFYIWAAFNFGFSYARWEESWHCMIQKKQFPFSQKMRIIQLFEGDFNAGLKYLMGRLLMWHIHDNDVIDEEVYGSRKGKTGSEALINLQLLADHSRTWKLNLALLFNDASGCYDRVPPNLGEMALMRIGCPKSIASAHTKAQRSMKHYVKIASGVSKGYIKFGKESKRKMIQGTILMLTGLIGGIGQGGGGSPIIWMAILLIMLGAYKEVQTGAIILDIINSLPITMWVISYVDDNSIVKHFQHTDTIPQMIESMKNSLHEWHKLLQITGGDLSLDKCKLTILKWRQVGERGNMTYVNEDDNMKTIELQSIHDDNVKKVERINPDKAERVLGVRLPLTGDMMIEKTFRKQQLLEFSKKLYRAPLSNYEAHIAYQSRYLSIAKYPLPVTIFTDSQLDEIQKPCMRLILPKLGVNRNMPRAVVYGPQLLGGMQLMNLKVEQPTMNITTTISHMRRQDRVAKMLLATLNDVQIEVGISKSFLNSDPSPFTYITANTRWLYTWRACYKLKIRVEIWKQWIPSTNYIHDRNIMEVAINDAYYQGRYNYRLISINRCRLFLQCFFISDLMDENTGCVPKGYLDGTKSRSAAGYRFPQMRKPTKLEWSEWKEFIIRNFLAGAYHVTPRPLPNRIPMEINQNDEILQMQKIDRKLTLHEIITNLPDEWRQMLGNIKLPSDDGRHISCCLVDGNVIGASDGSLIKHNDCSVGGHSYSLQGYDSDEMCIVGNAVTPQSTNMSSLTTELYGLIATTLIVYIIENKYCKDYNGMVKTTLTADNEQAITMGNKWNFPINISETQQHEYDLWSLLWKLQNACSTKIHYEWIRGHQDVNKAGEKVFGPHTRPVQLNIKMDKLAKEAMILAKETTVIRPTYSTTVMGCYTKTNMLIGDLHEYIQYVTTATPLIAYLMKKNNWTFEQLQTIQWNDIETALKSYKPYYKVKIAQLMHDWQYVGERQHLMGDNTNQCPSKCGEVETKLHYLKCKDVEMTKNRAAHLKTLQQRLRVINTYPGIVSTISKLLTSDYDENWWDDYDITDSLTNYLKMTVKKQCELGQHSVPKGYLISEWSQLQLMWEEATNSTASKYCWGKEIICSLHTYVYDVWKSRNDIVHGKTEKSLKQIKRANLQSKVEHLYKKGRANLNLKEKSYFKLPIEQRQKRGIESLSLWVQIVECMFKRRGAARQEKIDDWLITDKSSPADLRQPKGKHKNNDDNNCDDTTVGTNTIIRSSGGGVEASRS